MSESDPRAVLCENCCHYRPDTPEEAERNYGTRTPKRGRCCWAPTWVLVHPDHYCGQFSNLYGEPS